MKIMDKLKVYIGGGITGVEDFKEHFDNAERMLNREGCLTENPARFYIENGNWTDYMKLSVKKLTECDKIYMLKGWENSKGAKIEYELAKLFNMTVDYEN